MIEQDEDRDIECPDCKCCGEDECCPALICAKKKMVGGTYCKTYYKDIELWYTLGKRLNDKYLDTEIFDEVWGNINKKG